MKKRKKLALKIFTSFSLILMLSNVALPTLVMAESFDSSNMDIQEGKEQDSCVLQELCT